MLIVDGQHRLWAIASLELKVSLFFFSLLLSLSSLSGSFARSLSFASLFLSLSRPLFLPLASSLLTFLPLPLSLPSALATRPISPPASCLGQKGALE